MIIITKVIDTFTRIIKWIAMVVVVLMMLTIAVGVVSRLFGSPIVGNDEIVEILQVILIMFSLAYAQSEDRHITIGIIVDHLPRRVQNGIDFFGYVATAVLCFIIGVIFWNAGLENVLVTKETTLLLEFPHYILKFTASLGFMLWGLEAVNRIIKLALGMVKTMTQLEKEVSA